MGDPGPGQRDPLDARSRTSRVGETLPHAAASAVPKGCPSRAQGAAGCRHRWGEAVPRGCCTRQGWIQQLSVTGRRLARGHGGPQWCHHVLPPPRTGCVQTRATAGRSDRCQRTPSLLSQTMCEAPCVAPGGTERQGPPPAPSGGSRQGHPGEGLGQHGQQGPRIPAPTPWAQKSNRERFWGANSTPSACTGTPPRECPPRHSQGGCG